VKITREDYSGGPELSLSKSSPTSSLQDIGYLVNLAVYLAV